MTPCSAIGSFIFSLTAICYLAARVALAAEPQPVPRDDGPTSKDYPALHNLLAATDKIYSGGEPDGEEAFASLHALGVKTIVSVDGAQPDVKTARKHGLRYIHIPIGYDGIEAAAGAALARVAREAESPLYVHCHHGTHRGPAAAAAICIAAGAVDGRGALRILERAGTSKQYAGLWRDVAAYRAPSADARPPDLPEIAAVDSLAAAMAKIDRACDELKAARQTDWQAPPEHPDLVPVAQAALVREQFRESGRLLSDGYDARFRQWLSAAEADSSDLEKSLRAGDKSRAADALQRLEKSCQACHQAYRN